MTGTQNRFDYSPTAKSPSEKSGNSKTSGKPVLKTWLSRHSEKSSRERNKWISTLQSKPSERDDSGTSIKKDTNSDAVDTHSRAPVKEMAARLQARVNQCAQDQDLKGKAKKSERWMSTDDACERSSPKTLKTSDAIEDSCEPISPVTWDGDRAMEAAETNVAPATGDEMVVRFEWAHTNAKEVYLAGTFNHWSRTACPMELGGDVHHVAVPLKTGKYWYKFVVDGDWHYDITRPSETDVDGNINNIIIIPEQF